MLDWRYFRCFDKKKKKNRISSEYAPRMKVLIFADLMYTTLLSSLRTFTGTLF